MPFTEVFRRSEFSSPAIDYGSFLRDDGVVEVPNTARLHAALVRHSVHGAKEVCIVAPIAKTENLSLIAADILTSTTSEQRDQVFVLSADTGVRERFRTLIPPFPKTDETLSELETPVANVTAEGGLSDVTKTPSEVNHPRFLFSYTSKRLPTDEVASNVACALFDDTVKVTEQRLKRLRDWRRKNDVPTIAYFTSSPLSDVYREVAGDAITWTWPTELLGAALNSDERRRQDLSIF